MKKPFLYVPLFLVIMMTLSCLSQRLSVTKWTAYSIAGEYVLYRADDPNMRPVTKMAFTALDENTFAVKGIGQSWEGVGKTTDNKGYYDWEFTDGKTGRTTFIINNDGTIKGHVNGSGINWVYIAHKLP